MDPVAPAMTVDVALVGGGLANLLIAWRLADMHPGLHVRIFEQAPTLGGSKTWSFHESDLDPSAMRWLLPLVRRSWPRQDVRFPGVERRLEAGYHSVSAEALAARCLERFGDRVELGRAVTGVGPTLVTFADGGSVAARTVIDGRGWVTPSRCRFAYQRFLGRELELARPHGLVAPVIMDATVPQLGGFRFMYVLPFDERTVLLEDTLYAERAPHDDIASRDAIARYAADRGWVVERVIREERGALPLPLAARYEELEAMHEPGVPTVGVRAGLFHATTGYSLPFAVRVADRIAECSALDSASLAADLRALARETWRRQRYFRMLNRMLFDAAAPGERIGVLARFYRLPYPLIARFYADRLTAFDRFRILAGRPPVPLGRALAALAERVPSPGA